MVILRIKSFRKEFNPSGVKTLATLLKLLPCVLLLILSYLCYELNMTAMIFKNHLNY